MKWFVMRSAILWLALLILTIIVLTLGRLQSPPISVAILRLADCKLPCWIGIVPGKTTIAEAQELIRQAYGDNPAYTLNYISVLRFGLISPGVPGHLEIALQQSSGDQLEQSIVQTVSLVFYTSPGTTDGPLSVGSLYERLGHPESVVLSDGVNAPNFAALYEGQRVQLFFDIRECGKLSASAPVKSIVLYSRSPIRSAWASRIEIWRGFETCYHFQPPEQP